MNKQLDDRIASILAQSPHMRHRNLRFEASEGQVTLRGVVKTRYEKQMAQEMLRGLEGVHGIENQLEVTSVD